MMKSNILTAPSNRQRKVTVCSPSSTVYVMFNFRFSMYFGLNDPLQVDQNLNSS